MKPLKPSMKENKRYLIVRGRNLKENIPKAIKDFVGVLGMSKASLEFIKFFENEGAIISVNRESLNNVRASFVVWPEKIEVMKVSGTLKGLNSKD
jgi:RNase P/RNase MRP subunit POP5